MYESASGQVINLTKLSWRLVEWPDSLLAKILKGKYNPTSSFMDCSTSSNTSHGWNGIMAGKEVLKRGVGWLVGDGKDIKVWGEPWLLVLAPQQPIRPPTFEALSLKVSDLIWPNSNAWNVDAIRRHLPIYEEIITKITLSSFPLRDSIAWLPVKSGSYSTKSGYALTKMNNMQDVVEDFDWKTCIWQVKTTPKVKLFLWKMKNRALPVGKNLVVRGITNVSRCKHCDEVEDELHIILNCPFAVRVWELAPVYFP